MTERTQNLVAQKHNSETTTQEDRGQLKWNEQGELTACLHQGEFYR
jgi:hypothetical protein